jgi:hypothetical protein
MNYVKSHRPITLRIVTGILLLVTALMGIAEAANIRGRLYRQTRGGTFPAQGIPVTVFAPNIGRSAYAYSGSDGMYYLYNIPDGNYTLEIWVYPNSPPLTFQIRAAGGGFSDIGPIRVP